MKDFLGNELGVGDKVIFPTPQYRDLRFGKIIGFTPKKARIEYVYQGYTTTYLIEPNLNVIKAPEKEI